MIFLGNYLSSVDIKLLKKWIKTDNISCPISYNCKYGEPEYTFCATVFGVNVVNSCPLYEYSKEEIVKILKPLLDNY